MNIREHLEAEHSKTSTTAIVNFIGSDKKKFKVLMDLFLEGEYRITQRAAWPLSYAAIEHPELVTPYFGKLVKKLQQPDQHPAIARNILRLFQETEIPEKYCGILTDICFGFITDQTRPAAIRAFAISVAANLCSAYPELKNELMLILDDLRQFPQPPAIQVRIKSALKKLKAAQ